MSRFENEAFGSVEKLIASQITQWDLARSNYTDLEKALLRTIVMDNGCRIKVQFNPSRMRSSAARVDKKSVSNRRCFLCAGNLPDQQRGLAFEDRYLILVNPFPIFGRHLTIPLKEHTDQLIGGRFGDMLRLSRFLDSFIVFYNGAQCGASAPDHFHFQAGNKGFMPIEEEYHHFPRKLLTRNEGCTIAAMDGYYRNTLVLSGNNIEVLTILFDKIYHILRQLQESGGEPMMNILAGYEDGLWRIFIFPRRAHRPRQFFEKDEGQILISPASVDFGGVWITPRREDYDKLDGEAIMDIFAQVSYGSMEWQNIKNRLCNHK
jgi:hypothetical protein